MKPEPEPDAPRPPVPPADSSPATAGPHEGDTKTIPLAEVLPGDLDYEVLNLIGYGGYGEVYLARAQDGSFFAVKVVYRVSFEDQRPYEREYEGIRYFEPVSKLSESQLQILRVGRRDEAGYFYYIMEAADDLSAGRQIQPTTYIPRTLKSEMQQHGGRIPVRASCEIGLALAAALENLHSHRLVHRDIKPANIIFVHNSAKLADPGLVAAANQTLTCVGTEGYIPPEGPGSPRADIYALGMVLYEAFTGFRRQDFPHLPEDLEEWPEHALALQLNKIVTKACQANPRRRYQSAREIRRDLERLLQRHRPPVTAVTPVQPRRWLPAFSIAVMLLLALAGGICFWHHRTAEKAAALAASPDDTDSPSAEESATAPAPLPASTMTAVLSPEKSGSYPLAELQTLLTGTLDNGATNTPGQLPVRSVNQLVAGPDNAFYAWAGGGQLVKLGLDGKLSVFARFGPADGSVTSLAFNPRESVLYGTTGGDSKNGRFGQWFRLSSLGEINPIASFSEQQTPRPVGLVFNPLDGNFYGTLRYGGSKNLGVLLKLDPAGTPRIIASFIGTNGLHPPLSAPLLAGEDGSLYGVTRGGGEHNLGTVYCCRPNGEIRTLHSFAGADGQGPVTGLVRGNDGFLYGTTLAGSSNNLGNIFKLSTAGGFQVVAAFDDGNGIFCKQLCCGRDGNIYGYTAAGGGAGGYGKIFRVTPSCRVDTVFAFNGRNGSEPRELVQGADGNFYGICQHGGAGFADAKPRSGSGTIFRLVLSPATASRPAKPPSLPLAITHVRTADKTDSTPLVELHTLLQGTLDNGIADTPGQPKTSWIKRLVAGQDGNFYAAAGRDVIRVTPDGRLTTLLRFQAAEGPGVNNLVLNPLDGWLYGTTVGSHRDGHWGQFFRVDLAGHFACVANFADQQIQIQNSMVFNPFDSNFYGITIREKEDLGVAVQMSLAGRTAILAAFDKVHGRAPRGDLAVDASDGTLYGTTGSGGESDQGVAYALNLEGKFRTLHSFNGSDGQWPISGLIWGRDGQLYGASAVGGKYGKGTIYRISQTGDSKLLTAFDYGSRPRACRLCCGTDGNVYGVTLEGVDANSFGTLFRLTPDGELQKLFIFNGNNGSFPRDLIQGPDGNLYGVCDHGGTGFTGDANSGDGTVFRLVMHPH